MSDSCNITNPFQSLQNIVAFSCRDWSADPEDAWIYGIINGWGFDEDDEGKSCTDELERKFGSNKWTKSDTKRLKVLHNNWEKAKELMAKYAKEKEMKTKYFILNYEEQITYLEKYYSSAKKRNCILSIILFLSALFAGAFEFFIVKNKYPEGLRFAPMLIPLAVVLINSLFRDEFENFYKDRLKEIKNNNKVQLQQIINNKYKYFIDLSNENDFISCFVNYSKGYLCNDFHSFQNGTVSIQDNAETVWDKSEEGKIKYNKIIDLSDNHTLSVEEIKSHSYKDV